jgi:hypothetical protein
VALPGAVPRGPLVFVGIPGAEDFEFTVIGKAGTMRWCFGPDGGALASEGTVMAG